MKSKAVPFSFKSLLTLTGGLVVAWCCVQLLGHSQAQTNHNRGAGSDNPGGLPTGIVWYGILTDGLEVAKESGRPIFLLSAAPQCAGIPGMW